MGKTGIYSKIKSQTRFGDLLDLAAKMEEAKLEAKLATKEMAEQWGMI